MVRSRRDIVRTAVLESEAEDDLRVLDALVAGARGEPEWIGFNDVTS